MSRTVRRIVLRTPDAVGSAAQYTALVQCRQASAQARSDGSLASQARSSAEQSAQVALTARDQAVAAAGRVKVTSNDATPGLLDASIQVTAPLAKAVQNPGDDETLLLSVAALTGATAGAARAPGVVQAPAGAQARFLRGDATWQAVDKAAVGLGNVTNEAQIPTSIGTAKGDLVVFTGAGAPARLGLGTDGKVLTADAASSAGVKWGDLPGAGAWQAAETPTRTTDYQISVTDNAANQDIFRPGRPIRFRQNSGTAWMYGMVSSYASGTVTIGGAAFTTAIAGDAGRGLQYADMTRLHVETLVFNGFFADAADSALIAHDLLASLVWGKGNAYCVKFMVLPKVDDSGANQPRINVMKGGNPVSTQNSNNGVAINDGYWTQTSVDMSTNYYKFVYQSVLEVSVDANGSNKDARDLTVIIFFVLE